MRTALTLLTVCAGLAGCATTIQTTAIPSSNTQQIYRSGIPSLISTKKYTVMVSPAATTRKGSARPEYVVSVANTTGQPIEVDTSNISVFVDSKRLKVFSYEEIEREIQNKKSTAAFLTAFSGAMRSYSAQQQASYQQTYGTYNTNTFGTVNSYGTGGTRYGSFNANTYGTYSGWTYNPGAGQLAANAENARTQAELQNINANGEAALREAAGVMLRRQTVMPGQAYGGKVVVAEIDVPEYGNKLLIKVSIDGETHEFGFSQRKLKK